MGRRKLGSVRVSIYALSLLSGVLISGTIQAGYDEDVKPIIESKCASCHASKTVKLSTQAEVQASIAKVVAAISIDPNGADKSKLMPPEGALSPEDIAKIRAWQSESGSPENNTSNADTKPANTATNRPADAGTTPGTDVPKPGTDTGKPTPLVIDLEGQGHFAFAETAVAFDILGNGVKSLLSWPRATAAFLALDLNGNKLIDNGSELFGDSTLILNTQSKKAANGFAALEQYDSNHDGFIDSSDAVFTQLLVWHDKNENGLTDSEELSTLASHAIISLSLTYKSHFQTMKDGSESPLLVGFYEAADSEGMSTKKVLADIFLSYQAK